MRPNVRRRDENEGWRWVEMGEPFACPCPCSSLSSPFWRLASHLGERSTFPTIRWLVSFSVGYRIEYTSFKTRSIHPNKKLSGTLTLEDAAVADVSGAGVWPFFGNAILSTAPGFASLAAALFAYWFKNVDLDDKLYTRFHRFFSSPQSSKLILLQFILALHFISTFISSTHQRTH